MTTYPKKALAARDGAKVTATVGPVSGPRLGPAPGPPAPAMRKDASNPQQGMTDPGASAKAAAAGAAAPLAVVSREATDSTGGRHRIAHPVEATAEALAALDLAPSPPTAPDSGAGAAEGRKPRLRTPPNERDSRKLFVGGLHANVTHGDFLEFFEQYGEVIDSVVITDRVTKRSRGFGFVTFACEKYAAAILTAVPGRTGFVTLHGKRCEVKASTPKQDDGRYQPFRPHAARGFPPPPPRAGPAAQLPPHGLPHPRHGPGQQRPLEGGHGFVDDGEAWHYEENYVPQMGNYPCPPHPHYRHFPAAPPPTFHPHYPYPVHAMPSYSKPQGGANDAPYPAGRFYLDAYGSPYPAPRGGPLGHEPGGYGPQDLYPTEGGPLLPSPPGLGGGGATGSYGPQGHPAEGILAPAPPGHGAGDSDPYAYGAYGHASGSYE